jgi:UDP-galactopyranose mutase
MNKIYDYLLVGSGLFNGVFVWLATQKNKRCLVIDKRNHIGGNIYTGDTGVHKYGAGYKKVYESF